MGVSSYLVGVSYSLEGVSYYLEGVNYYLEGVSYYLVCFSTTFELPTEQFRIQAYSIRYPN